MALKIQGKTLDEELIDLTLENVELNGLKHRKCNELSGGQRQRLAIARAIIKNPAVIIADEPTGNLDSSTSKQIFTILQKISSSCLVIIVSHDEESAKKYGDYHVKLEDGEVIESSLPKTNKIEKIKFY